MAANGPVICTTPDVQITPADNTEHALSSVVGVNYSEQLAVGLIEALVAVSPDANCTEIVVSIYRGPAVTGTFLQAFLVTLTDAVAAQQRTVPVRFLDAQPPGANVQYALSVQQANGAGASTVTCYGFTVTTFPGGVNVFAPND